MSGTDGPVPLRVLLLEDSPLDAELVAEALSQTGLVHRLDRAVGRADFTAALGREPYDLILADFVLPDFDGMSALALARQACPRTPFIFVSGTLGEEIAVEALKTGATDYVLKQRLDRLPATVLRALEEARVRRERHEAQERLGALLAERTALLDELDHRVRNNIQLLLSLISLDLRRVRSEEAREALGRIRLRVQALGHVHRELAGTAGVERFDAGSFVRDLVADLIAVSGRDDIALAFDLSPVALPSETAAAVALLLNEILVVSLFPPAESPSGNVIISLTASNDGCVFEIHHLGRPARGMGEAADRRQGPILIALAQQLKACIDWPIHEPMVLVRVSLPFGKMRSEP